MAGIFSRRSGSIISVGLAVAAALTLTGCSKAGATSCSDFNAQGISAQTETLRNLLSEHDLETASLSNVQGVTRAVSQLCANNPSAKLDDAADWNAKTW